MRRMDVIGFMPAWSLYAIAGVLGAILGSFANVCISRLPNGESVIRPRSHCPRCGYKLDWWENIPIISFVFLGGRCSNCRERISLRYPLVELISVALAIFLWWRYPDPLHFLVYFCLLVTPLIIVSFIDLKHRIIPDIISIPGIFAGIGIHTLFSGEGKFVSGAIDAVAGAATGGLFLFFVAVIYEKIKKQAGLGGGDIKLIAMLGAFFGWRAAILILCMSSILGSLVGVILITVLRKDMKFAIPFGPFLSIAGIIQLIFGDWLILWYSGITYQLVS